MSELEDARARICAALEQPEDDWIAHAVRVISAHRNQYRAQRIFDVSTDGGRVRAARCLAGMHQAELSRRVKLPQQTLSDIELDRRKIPLRKVAGLALSLGVKVPWLLGASLEGGPNPEGAVLRQELKPSEVRKRKKQRDMAAAREKARIYNALRAQELDDRIKSETRLSTNSTSPLKTPAR